MASTLEFVRYVCDQLALAGTITWKRMFFAVICDDQLFIKITPEVAARMPDCPKAPAYPGAKESFLMEDLDDRERLAQIVRATCDALSKPKTRRPKTAKSE